MTSFHLITDDEFARFSAVLRENGWGKEDFELQEEELDQAQAEVENCTGQVGIRSLLTQAVEVYRLGPGWEWVADFPETSATANSVNRRAHRRGPDWRFCVHDPREYLIRDLMAAMGRRWAANGIDLQPIFSTHLVALETYYLTDGNLSGIVYRTLRERGGIRLRRRRKLP